MNHRKCYIIEQIYSLVLFQHNIMHMRHWTNRTYRILYTVFAFHCAVLLLSCQKGKNASGVYSNAMSHLRSSNWLLCEEHRKRQLEKDPRCPLNTNCSWSIYNSIHIIDKPPSIEEDAEYPVHSRGMISVNISLVQSYIWGRIQFSNSPRAIKPMWW